MAKPMPLLLPVTTATLGAIFVHDDTALCLLTKVEKMGVPMQSTLSALALPYATML